MYIHDDPLDTYSNSFIDTSRFNYTIDTHDCQEVTATLLLQLVNHSVNMKQKIKAISLSVAPTSQLDDWNSFKYFTAPCLQYMKFSFTQETEEIFAAVIRNCPTLKEVIIFRLLCAPSNVTIDALKTLPVLQCFAIENVCRELYPEKTYSTSMDSDEEDDFVARCNTRVCDTVIRQFFTYHVLLDSQSTLQEVRLRHISYLEPETFETLFKIKSLKSLNFAGFGLLNNHRDFGPVITSAKRS